MANARRRSSRHIPKAEQGKSKRADFEEADARRRRAEAPTVPPPPKEAPRPSVEPTSGPRRKRAHSKVAVDEVTADLSKDKRHER